MGVHMSMGARRQGGEPGVCRVIRASGGGCAGGQREDAWPTRPGRGSARPRGDAGRRARRPGGSRPWPRSGGRQVATVGQRPVPFGFSSAVAESFWNARPVESFGSRGTRVLQHRPGTVPRWLAKPVCETEWNASRSQTPNGRPDGTDCPAGREQVAGRAFQNVSRNTQEGPLRPPRNCVTRERRTSRRPRGRGTDTRPAPLAFPQGNLRDPRGPRSPCLANGPRRLTPSPARAPRGSAIHGGRYRHTYWTPTNPCRCPPDVRKPPTT